MDSAEAGEPPAVLAAALMQARQTILPKRLVAPGPDAEQLQWILEAAASAPDHGQILPWRFVIVQPEARSALAEVFAQALLERDASASAPELSQAREKAFRAPLLLLVVANQQVGDAAVDWNERLISTGCAIQNMLLMACSLGFGSSITSGKALKSGALRRLFQLDPADHALCFLSVGTVLSARPQRQRPLPVQYVRLLDRSAQSGDPLSVTPWSPGACGR